MMEGAWLESAVQSMMGVKRVWLGITGERNNGRQKPPFNLQSFRARGSEDDD